jgi:hypothetical protein
LLKAALKELRERHAKFAEMTNARASDPKLFDYPGVNRDCAMLGEATKQIDISFGLVLAGMRTAEALRQRMAAEALRWRTLSDKILDWRTDTTTRN